MADFFRSALGYLGNVANREDNDFVGQNVELGDAKYRVKRVIAEGGLQLSFLACRYDSYFSWLTSLIHCRFCLFTWLFQILWYLFCNMTEIVILYLLFLGGFAFVYVAEEQQSGKEYALKVGPLALRHDPAAIVHSSWYQELCSRPLNYSLYHTALLSNPSSSATYCCSIVPFLSPTIRFSV